jgi:hypothetical protein
MTFARRAVSALGCALLACGSSPAAAPPAQHGDDAGTHESGAPFVPAAHRPLPQLLHAGGSVLTNATVVPVTFDGDPLRADLERFVAAFGASSWWKQTTAEYGVGALAAGTPVHVAETPPSGTIDDAAVEQWVAAHLDGTHADWGSPSSDKLYAVFYPQGTSITLDGLASCTDYLGGYHYTMNVGGVRVAYAAIVRCDQGFGDARGALDATTVGLAHELVESSTDPFLDGWSRPDDESLFPFAFSGEAADLCEFEGGVALRGSDVGYVVHRAWSNAAARAGHDPCSPAPAPAAVPYFNSAPVLGDAVSFDYFGQQVMVTGVRVPLGQTRTVSLQLFSDAETAPWTVSAEDVRSFRGGAPLLSFALDRSTGGNGDVLHLSITALAADPMWASEPFVITSTSGAVSHRWFAVAGQ